MAALTLAIARDNEPDWSIPGNCCAAVADAINEKASGTVSRSGHVGAQDCATKIWTDGHMLTRPMLVVLVLVVLVLGATTNRAEQRLSAESDRDQNEVQWFQRQPRDQ